MRAVIFSSDAGYDIADIGNISYFDLSRPIFHGRNTVHRIDNPAVIYKNGEALWFEKGIFKGKTQFSDREMIIISLKYGL